MLMSNVQNYCRALLFLGGAILFSLPAVAPAAPDTVSTAPMKSLRSITPLPPNAFDEGTCEGSEELFDHEVGLLKSNKLVSFDLNKIWQIETNSFNWSGEKDCSLVCDIGFTPNAVVGVGELRDDTPFMRALANPRLPAGSEPPYAADAIEFVFEDTTSATRCVRVFLDFGPAGTRPRLIMTDTFSTMKKRMFDGGDAPCHRAERKQSDDAIRVCHSLRGNVRPTLLQCSSAGFMHHS